MPPEDPSSRPIPGRQPYPRRRVSVDGILSRPSPRPDYLGNRATPHSLEVIQPISTSPSPAPPQPTVPPASPQPQAPSLPQAQSEASAPAPPPEAERFAPPEPTKKSLKAPKFTKGLKVRKPTVSRRVVKIILIVIAVLLVMIGAYAALRHQANSNNPDTVFKDALQASLSSTKFQSETTTGDTDNKVNYDLTTPTNPIISTEQTIKLAGNSYDVVGYGSAKNSYISYRSLPKTVAPSLSAVVKDAWVGLRANGALPAGIPLAVSSAPDPRDQAYGPVVFANISPKARKQQVLYMIQHKVYGYSTDKVTATKIGDTKVLIYDVRPNVGYLKIANQSAALSAGLTATEIQNAVNSLDGLKDANMKIYISASGHQLVQVDIVKHNQTTTTKYTYDANRSLPAEPQTKLSWANFASYQFQIESQASSKQPAAQVDIARKTQIDSLHKYLADYFKQNESYPSLANINDQSWVAGNLSGLDPDVLRDPLSATLTILAAPKPAVFAYQPLPASGKGACDNTDTNQCAHYKLIATLSNNQQYLVQDP